jgi:WhiB family transcriptional regulator, redox-sensing transcriptional regulator
VSTFLTADDVVPCQTENPELWFPRSQSDLQESRSEKDYAMAKKICYEDCPDAIRWACLRYALDNNEQFGVWGATSPMERAKVRRERERAA